MDVCIDREAARNGIDKAKAKQNIIKTDKYRRGFLQIPHRQGMGKSV